jgi:glycine cleavage system aminomethyltransferase T
VVGKVSSSDMGHSLGAMLAMAYVPPEFAVDGTVVRIASAEGAAAEATVFTRAAYDPEGKRAKS